MRLLLVNSATAGMWGGGEMWFTEAARWFTSRGHNVRVVGRPGSRFLEAVRESGLDAIDFDFGGDYDPFAAWHAFQLQRQFQPDIVLVNFNKDAWLFGRGAKLLGIPTVARHGLTLFKNKLVHRLVYRWHMDRVVVNARSIRNDYEQLGFDTRKIEVILNGVRLVDEQPGELRRRLGIEADTLLIGGAGRLDHQKRFDRFIRIADSLVRRGVDARFVILGDGSGRAELERQHESTDLGDRLLFGGFCEDLAARAGDLDLFLLTSQNEGTPNALLEVMARGVPSLAFGVGAVPEILTGDCSPGLIESGDEDQMSEAAAHLIAHRELLRALGDAQQRRVCEQLTFDASMQKYEAFLESAAH
jgi:glycosyltransferase involved in cell wall biosynthesis